MSQHISIHDSLSKSGQDFEVLPQVINGNLIDIANGSHVQLKNVARSVLLSDDNGALLLAIIPASHCIDIAVLGRQLRCSFKAADAADVKRLFPGCHSDYLPPFSLVSVLPCIIDDNLAGQDQIYFPTEKMQLVRMIAEDFHDLLEHALHGFNFSYPMPGHNTTTQKQDLIILPTIFEHRLSALDALPSVPETTRQLLRLLNSEHARVNELSCIVDQDPMLSMQLLKQARSSLYGFGSNIETTQQAILQVLGYDTALHMAIGMSAAQSFQGSKQGLLGQKNIYRNAILVSALSETLAKKIPISKRPSKGSAQLGGLLHNLGYLLLSHLFNDEYEELNKKISSNTDSSIWEAIKIRFDTSPESVATWLMEFWQMPEALIVAQREQRNPSYNRKHASLAGLILLSNRLLYNYGFGDANTNELPDVVLEQLGIDESIAVSCAENVMDNRSDLEHIAEQLVA